MGSELRPVEKFVILDDFPFWTTYLLGFLVAAGFLAALMALLRSRLFRQSGGQVISRDRARADRQLGLFVIIGAAAVWFLGSSMYLRFHAVAMDANGMRLVYFWPRPAVAVANHELLEIKLVRAYRPCGHMEVTTARDRFLSINFKNCKPAEELLREASPHATKHSQASSFIERRFSAVPIDCNLCGGPTIEIEQLMNTGPLENSGAGGKT